jgi:hypothetical protein
MSRVDMTRTRLILALLVAAAVGFGLGWMARQVTPPSLEERARTAVTDLWKKLHRE